MAIVQHIIAIYSAEINLTDSDLGGLKVQVVFAGAKCD
ncbi:sensor histidine kinase [Pseudoalteromonas sp. SM9913]|nr:sensor histidine kinase [Pseudoalteromonas sp. SM9913]